MLKYQKTVKVVVVEGTEKRAAKNALVLRGLVATLSPITPKGAAQDVQKKHLRVTKLPKHVQDALDDSIFIC